MSFHNYKKGKKVANKPEKKREVQKSGPLTEFIIRTRRQSRNEKMATSKRQSNMEDKQNAGENANVNAETIQGDMPSSLNSTSNNELRQDNEELRQVEQPLNEIVEEKGQAIETDTSQQITPANSPRASTLGSQAAEIFTAESTGRVANIVNQINNTPRQVEENITAKKLFSSMETNAVHVENVQSQSSVTGMPACCGQHDKLGNIMQKLNDTTQQLSNTVQGLQQELTIIRQQKQDQDTEVSALRTVQEQDSAKLSKALETITANEKKIETLVGIMSKQDQQINSLKQAINGMHVRSMRRNLVINGIPEKRGENLVWSVLEFFKKHLKIDRAVPVKNAYRLGYGQHRPAVIELENVEDKGVIFQNVGHLKNVKNEEGRSFFVSEQLPEEFAERRRQQGFIKAQNNKLPTAEQLPMEFKKGDLYIENDRFQHPIRPPTVRQQVLPSAWEADLTRKVEIFEGDTRDRDDSVFVGYAAKVDSVDLVQGAYMKVRQAHPDASHVMCAYRFPGNNPTKSYGISDDGEHGGGRRILKVLRDAEVFNCALFVVRYYGGRHIGADRFTLIEDVSKSALMEMESELQIQSGASNWGSTENLSSAGTYSNASSPGHSRARSRFTQHGIRGQKSRRVATSHSLNLQNSTQYSSKS